MSSEKKKEAARKINAMLDILDRDCGETKEEMLTNICDLCHHPYILSEEQLIEKCSECAIARDLEVLMEKQRTVTTGRIMSIMAQEMHVSADKEGA